MTKRRVKTRMDDLPKPWEERPVSIERWRRHRETLMKWSHAGSRPPEWWLHERGMLRPNNQAAWLYDTGELTEAELAELMPIWHEQYLRAQQPGFTYCIGHAKPSDTFATWIDGAEARESHYCWVGIPRSLIKQWDDLEKKKRPAAPVPSR